MVAFRFGNKDELHAKLSTFISPNKTQIEFGVSLCKVNVIRMTKEPFRLQDMQVKSILKPTGQTPTNISTWPYPRRERTNSEQMSIVSI